MSATQRVEAAADPRAADRVRTGRLWAGLLLGPATWKLQLMLNYGVVPYACWHDLSVAIHGASLATLLVALASVRVAWGSWRRLGEGHETERGGALGRSRFLAIGGMAAGAFFAFLILGQWIPNLLLGPCDGLS